ncbi:hypothetical protein B566_EDAN007058 [Ephemera danica]|nr:hypothetical protein B566_EDAN007058 [Ephemera danica]
MSSQKGNTSRTRAQKHKNSRAFKNDLHDKTPKVKTMNGLNIQNVCDRCKCILEWKIKYKKYKLLTAPKKCTKCHEKKIKHAYHILCVECACVARTCPRCGKEAMPANEQAAADNATNRDDVAATKTSKIAELIAKFSAQVKLEEDGESSSEDFSSDVSFSNCSDSDDE